MHLIEKVCLHEIAIVPLVVETALHSRDRRAVFPALQAAPPAEAAPSEKWTLTVTTRTAFRKRTQTIQPQPSTSQRLALSLTSETLFFAFSFVFIQSQYAHCLLISNFRGKAVDAMKRLIDGVPASGSRNANARERAILLAVRALASVRQASAMDAAIRQLCDGAPAGDASGPSPQIDVLLKYVYRAMEAVSLNGAAGSDKSGDVLSTLLL